MTTPRQASPTPAITSASSLQPAPTLTSRRTTPTTTPGIRNPAPAIVGIVASEHHPDHRLDEVEAASVKPSIHTATRRNQRAAQHLPGELAPGQHQPSKPVAGHPAGVFARRPTESPHVDVDASSATLAAATQVAAKDRRREGQRGQLSRRRRLTSARMPPYCRSHQSSAPKSSFGLTDHAPSLGHAAAVKERPATANPITCTDESPQSGVHAPGPAQSPPARAKEREEAPGTSADGSPSVTVRPGEDAAGPPTEAVASHST